MEIILIFCSATKIDGGIFEYSPSHLAEYLSTATLRGLLKMRLQLAQMKRQAAGPDLGGDIPAEKLQYMPAYLRYAGIIYQRSNFVELFPRVCNKKVLIISALYGILDAHDSIQMYDAVMTESLPGGMRIHTWWNRNALGAVLHEYIQKLKPDRIHDLLPDSYRKALYPLPPRRFDKSDQRFIFYDDLGQGQGTSWRRGDILRELLSS